MVYGDQELKKDRPNPFGPTHGDLKRGLEFGQLEYEAIDQYCKMQRIMWTSSCWDEASVAFTARFDGPFFKIAFASLTDDDLLRRHRDYGKPIVLSTGMSTLEEIDRAVEVVGKEDLIMLHCTSTCPSKLEELNLDCIGELRRRYDLHLCVK